MERQLTQGVVSVKKLALSVFGTLAAIIAIGAIYQFSAAYMEREEYPAPGKMYEIDGLSIHLDCRGTGSPTVILEAGLASGSLSWTLVHDALADRTRTCAYDRPGIDWSDPVDSEQSSTDVVERLHKLLEMAHITDSLVLVGMSAGGVHVRKYYAEFPDNVAGMVFVESVHDQQGNRLPSHAEGGAAGSLATILSACSWLQPVGFVRLIALVYGDVESSIRDIFPEEAANKYKANLNQSHTCAAGLLELRANDEEIRKVEPPVALGDLPLIVLSEGKAPEANEEMGITLEQARKEAEAWDILQTELTALSNNGERRIARQSGHGIQFEQPQLVIDAVSDMVTIVRLTPKH